jgi:hypothetical protein
MISTRLASAGSVATAWSGEMELASIRPIPLLSTWTRGPERPRMTGRLAPGAKLVERRPGRPARRSPRDEAGATARASSSRTSVAITVARWLTP